MSKFIHAIHFHLQLFACEKTFHIHFDINKLLNKYKKKSINKINFKIYFSREVTI